MEKEKNNFIKISIILVITSLSVLAIIYVMQISTYSDDSFAEVNQVLLNNEEDEEREERHEFTAYGHTFSYEGDDEVSFETSDYDIGYSIDRIAYNDDLEISTNLYWSYGPSYGAYQHFDPAKINYICDGTFLKANEGEGLHFIKQPTGPGERAVDKYIHDDLRWQYCETNENDYLKQFEFGEVSGMEVFSTGGGEIVYEWNVIYSRNIDGVNYFFSSSLNGEGFWAREDVERQTFCVAHNDCYDISSKEYLDILLEDEENQKQLAEWDKFVQSIELVK